jgi:hypothetical protein
VIVYADREFRDPLGRLAVRPVLNRLRLDSVKRIVNALFHRSGSETSPTAAHSTVVPGVWSWMIRLAKWLRAKDLENSLRSILREESGHELHIFIQHAHFSELQLASRWQGPAVLHLVLRYSPELMPESPRALSILLKGLGPNVRLYTDSERLSAEYERAGARSVTTLPVPILLPEKKNQSYEMKVAFLGSSRVEKGFCELPRLVEKLALPAMVQVTRDSPDPRIRECVAELGVLARRLPAGRLELLDSPVPMDTYYGWIERAGMVALPYLSKKYNASTSGIFVEALCFGVPVVCPAESWMADEMEEARKQGFSIGEIFSSLDALPAACDRIARDIDTYRKSVENFAAQWRRTHNADECVKRLLEH